MGNTGSAWTGNGGGGGMALNAEYRDLVSERERSEAAVDSVLEVLRDIRDEYGELVEAANVATVKGRGKNTVMGFYDPSNGEVSINDTYWSNHERMEDAYKACVDSGFHPSNGNKTGLQAVFAHEMGHALSDAAAARQGQTLDGFCTNLVKNASGAKSGAGMARYAGKISGYAKHSPAEAVAEAYADVYCNGNNAAEQSRAIINELNKFLNR